MIAYREKAINGRGLLIEKLLQHGSARNISNLNYEELLKWSEITPNIKASTKCKPQIQHPAICPSCDNIFPSKYKLTMHLKTNLTVTLLTSYTNPLP